MKNITLIFVSLFLLSACSRGYDGSINLPLLYKIDIQQGNVIEQKMIDKLRPGMTKDQVKFIMGTPVIVDPFHNNRWEYIFSYQKGGEVREQRHITLHFDEDKLTHASGDIDVSSVPRLENQIVTEDEAVIVPATSEEKGFFGRMLDKVTPGD
jgi:outer membrane protein assembly factor BamE